MPAAEALPHLLTIEELADHLGVTERHVRRLVAEEESVLEGWPFRAFRPERRHYVARPDAAAGGCVEGIAPNWGRGHSR